ncbi:hypothetical protein [Candidatus Uabimicrobium sp. HlEnr_7]|uniref:hypothetical protein n=1 Tax=Candidatus Uabimicrobium helgolandensis TaxID=3095367 RepID=UPI00355659A0
MALKGKLNEKEYAFLMRRAKYDKETIAHSAKKLGIREDYARQIAFRLRKRVEIILGISRKR